MKKWLRILSILLGVVVLLIALLPALLSTGFARGQVLARVNKVAPGRVAIDGWRFRWFGAQNIRGVSYDVPAGTRATVAEIKVEQGLLGLVRSYKDLGHVAVTKPVLVVALPEAAVEKPPAPEQPRMPPKPAVPPEKEAAALPLAWPDLRVTLDITEGRILAARAGEEPKPLVEILQAGVILNGTGGPAQMVVALRSGTGPGDIAASFSATPPPSKKEFLPGEIALATEVKITDWDLSKTLALIEVPGSVPAGQGRIHGDLVLSGTLDGGLHLDSAITVAGLELSGGPLKTDRPSFGDVILEAHAQVVKNAVTVSNLVLRSALFHVTASGAYGGGIEGTLQSRAQLDLAALAAALPATLGLRQGLEVLSGKLNLNATLSSKGGRYGLDAGLTLDDLQGRLDGKSLAWEEETRLALKADWAEGKARVESFTIEAPFLQAQGHGDLEDMTLAAAADIEKALAEAGKFVELKEWQAQGRARIALNVKGASPAARQATGHVTIEDFAVTQKGAAIVPAGNVALEFSSGVELPENRGPIYSQPSLGWQTWLSAGRVAAERAEANTETGLPAIVGLTLGGTVDMNALSTLLAGLKMLPADSALSGSARLSMKAATSGDEIRVSDAEVVLSDFSFREGDKVLRESQLTLQADATADAKRRTVVLPRLEVTCSAGKLSATDIRTDDWEKAAQNAIAKINAELDLGTLMKSLDGFVGLPEGVGIGGKATAHVTLASRSGAGPVLETSAHVLNLEITAPGQEPIREERVKLQAVIEQTPDSGRVELKQCRLEAAALSATAQGVYEGGAGRTALDFSGSVAPDLEVLAGYLRALAGAEIQMSGKAEQPFRLSAVSEADAGITTRTMHATVQLKADQIKAFGLDVQNIQVPVVVSNDLATARVHAAVNNGRLAFDPVVTLGEQGDIRLPQNAHLLEGVQLTDDLADGLLGLIHPLFRRCSGATGTVDLTMGNFFWPLSETRRNEAGFAGQLDLKGVQVSASGLVLKILEAAKVKERSVTLGDRSVVFTCRNGRIECSPLKLEVGGHAITMSGTVGLDQTIDYVAQVPVTRDMVGEQAFTYLEGTTVNLPVRGTVSQPQVDASSIAQAVTDLGGQAVRKVIEKEAVKALGKFLQLPGAPAGP